MLWTIRILPVGSRRKVRMRSDHHGTYELGYTRATMVTTKSSKVVKLSKSQKSYLSSDCTLQLECMKLKLLVIVNQHVTVNSFPGLVHTARQIMGIDFTLNW